MAKTAGFLPTYCELLTPKRKLSESIASGTGTGSDFVEVGVF